MGLCASKSATPRLQPSYPGLTGAHTVSYDVHMGSFRLFNLPHVPSVLTIALDAYSLRADGFYYHSPSFDCPH